MAVELGIAALTDLDHRAAQHLAAVEQVEHLLAFPAALPDHQQARGVGALRAHQPRPDLQQQQVVLARLDRSQHDEGRPLGCRNRRGTIAARSVPSGAAIIAGVGIDSLSAKAERLSSVAWLLPMIPTALASMLRTRSAWRSDSPARQYSGWVIGIRSWIM
jgi:hypothetical protein